MPTASELMESDDCQIGHALFVHGIDLVFVDHADLVGFNFGGSRVGRLGLQREGMSYGESINLRTGQIDLVRRSFTIVDFEGDLARLFGAVDDSERSLGDVPIGAGLPINPSGSLAARTDLHDKHIGTERIGPAGERHLYPAPPEADWGYHHTIAVPGLDLAGAPVSDNPIVWTGRRVVLYRLFRDHVTYPSLSAGTVSWRPFDEARVEWWGTILDEAEVSAREYKIEANGAASWLSKPLGIGYSPTPVRVDANVTLSTIDGAREDGMAFLLQRIDDSGVLQTYGDRIFVTTISAATADEIRDDVIAEIAATAADDPGTGSWNAQAGYVAQMLVDGSVQIGVEVNDGAGVLFACLHAKVWAALGYDIELQSSLAREPDEPRAVEIASVDEHGGLFAASVTGPGYYVGAFFTGHSEDQGWPRGLDNDGIPRTYSPQYLGGTAVLLSDLNGGAGQIVRLADAALGAGTSQSTVAHPGQLHRPPASDPATPTSPYAIPGVGNVDRQGLWLFSGTRRLEDTSEEFDEYWIALASWVNGTGQLDGLVNGDTIVVTNWLDPRRFGFDRPRPESDWVFRTNSEEGDVHAVPLCVLGYQEGSAYDHAHVVAQRLLYATGTSQGWDSYASDPDASIAVGQNEPTGVTIARDAEVAELGLGIPAAFIHDPSDWQAQAEKVDNDDVLDVKLAFTTGYQATDALRSLMQPVGWCWHLRHGKYGWWCPADSVTQEDATVNVTRAEKCKPYDEVWRPSKQDLRKFAPVDTWTYDYDWNPQTKKAGKKLELKSPDAGARYRPGQVDEKVLAHGMRRPKGLTERVMHLANFWRRRHLEVRDYPVHAVNPGMDLWPGTIFRITDDTLLDMLGQYGIAGRLAVVTKTLTEAGKLRLSKKISFMVFADRSATPRVHAPSARATGFDPGSDALVVEDNWLGIEADEWADAALFEEPEYEGLEQFGGTGYVNTYQWDGDTYSLRTTGNVVSVDATPGDARIVIDPEGEVYMRDMDTIVVLAPTDETSQGAWVETLHAPICNDAGQFDGLAVPTDGYPWEA